MVGIFCLYKNSEVSKILSSWENICGTNFYVVEVFIKKHEDNFFSKRVLKKAVKLFAKQGVYRVIYPKGNFYIKSLLSKFSLIEFDNLSARRVFAFEVLEKLQIITSDSNILVYSKDRYIELEMLIRKIINVKDEIRVIIENSYQNELLRREILDSFGVSVVTNRNKPKGEVFMICFDNPTDEILEVISPEMIFNLSNVPIYGENVISEFSIMSDEIYIPSHSNDSDILMCIVNNCGDMMNLCTVCEIFT